MKSNPDPARDSGLAVAADHRRHISRDDRVLDGEPVVRGSRIAVRSIVGAFQIYRDRGRVLAAFPSLTPAEIDSAVHYYEQHRDLVQRYIDENDAAVNADD